MPDYCVIFKYFELHHLFPLFSTMLFLGPKERQKDSVFFMHQRFHELFLDYSNHIGAKMTNSDWFGPHLKAVRLLWPAYWAPIIIKIFSKVILGTKRAFSRSKWHYSSLCTNVFTSYFLIIQTIVAHIWRKCKFRLVWAPLKSCASAVAGLSTSNNY